MFDAQTLIYDGTGYSVYSPWFPRGGDNLIASAEVVARSGGTVTVQVCSKESEAAGDGTDADSGTSLTCNAVDIFTDQWLASASPGMDDLVRYKFTVGGSSSGDWITFRMLAPQWFDTV